METLKKVLGRHNLLALDNDLHDAGHFPHLSVNALLAGMWDFGPLSPAPGVRASDLDFVLERNGHFLVLEFKAPGVALPIGQARLLRSLVDLSDRITLWVVRGEPGHPETIQVLRKDEAITEPKATSIQFLIEDIKAWWNDVC